LFRWVLAGVFFHFGFQGRGQVDVHAIGERQHVGKHIGQLFADGRHFFGVVRQRFQLVTAQPLKMFHEFGGFDGDGGREVLGVVEGLPGSFGHEPFHECLQIGNRGV